jgi:hypothetical protein
MPEWLISFFVIYGAICLGYHVVGILDRRA